MDKIPVSVIILAQNEEINIADCLKSVAPMEDVVIVDSGSTDKTLNVAKEIRPDVRIYHHEFRDFGDQRNWALDETDPRLEWILFLDADERCVPACRDAIINAVNRPGLTAGFYLTYRNLFMGRWIRHCTMYPSWQLRLLRKGQVRFRKEGHGQREISDGTLEYIVEPFDHEGFRKGIRDWLRKHERYTSDEVELIERLRAEPLVFRDVWSSDDVVRRRGMKRLMARMILFRPLLSFIYRYIWKKGFLDGFPGFLFCLLRVWVETRCAWKFLVRRKGR